MKLIATLGPIGFLPAPGTCSTLFTLLFIYLLSPFTLLSYFFLFITVFLVGFYVISASFKKIKAYDPSEIIFDEVIGSVVTFFAITISLKSMIIGFLLFRFFDITKVCGIKKVEKIPGALGVICDDIVAGLLSNVLLRVILHYW